MREEIWSVLTKRRDNDAEPRTSSATIELFQIQQRRGPQELTSETEKTEELEEFSRTILSIFVDANVLIPMFLRKDDTEFEILEVLSEAGKARLLTTDVTRIEVAKNLAEKDCEIISPIEKEAFRDRVKKMLDIPLSNIDMRRLYLQAYQRHLEDIEEKTTGRNWELLVSVRKVIESYESDVIQGWPWQIEDEADVDSRKPRLL